jgi:hypothetical protein
MYNVGCEHSAAESYVMYMPRLNYFRETAENAMYNNILYRKQNFLPKDVRLRSFKRGAIDFSKMKIKKLLSHLQSHLLFSWFADNVDINFKCICVCNYNYLAAVCIFGFDNDLNYFGSFTI